MLIRKKVEAGRYMVGEMLILRRRAEYWELWTPRPVPLEVGGRGDPDWVEVHAYRTLTEAVEAANREQADA